MTSDLTNARQLVMCTCTHPIVVHHLTPARHRTYCTHADAAGPCRCDEATPVVSAAVAALLGAVPAGIPQGVDADHPNES